MIFTTKAEYGVRLLVELGRQGQADGTVTPVSLKAIAEAELLPLAYLERIVARLKKAGFVESTRGAHGGYRLARSADEIRMDEVIVALEGQIAPMTCFIADDDPSAGESRVVCHHTDTEGHACATKLLWTRVQGGVQSALAGTTLAELVAFSQRQQAGSQRADVVAA
jgi:Rrf2 family protein